MNVTHSNYDS